MYLEMHEISLFAFFLEGINFYKKCMNN